jgi:N-acyl-D-aspartate/D-glutamate deacylase
LRYWVREEGALTLEQAIWRMSGQPAALWGLTDRGTVEVLLSSIRIDEPKIE